MTVRGTCCQFVRLRPPKVVSLWLVGAVSPRVAIDQNEPMGYIPASPPNNLQFYLARLRWISARGVLRSQGSSVSNRVPSSVTVRWQGG